MPEATEEIKGTCENCGYAFEGVIVMVGESYPGIKCPKCGQETQNWDQASIVEAQDVRENHEIEYNHVEKFETIDQ